MKPTLLNYRGQPLTQPVLGLREPVPRGPELPPRVLPRALRIANVIVGIASALAHGVPVAMVISMIIAMGGRLRLMDFSLEGLLILLMAAAACSSVLLVFVSFARRRGWIFAWAAVEFILTIGMCALVSSAAGQGSSVSQYVLLRGFIALTYTGMVAWMALPPERA